MVSQDNGARKDMYEPREEQNLLERQWRHALRACSYCPSGESNVEAVAAHVYATPERLAERRAVRRVNVQRARAVV
jgi:hypothetical protein